MRYQIVGLIRRATIPKKRFRTAKRSQLVSASKRWLQISTASANSIPSIEDPIPALSTESTADSPDATFEIIGAPFSLLSASLSASQILFTQRGTLVGVSGKIENAVSTLSILEPFRRIILGIPFFYQKISSASPVTALISTKSPLTSFAVVHLNGTLDWMIAQRQALLAWTGHTLSITPTVNRKMSLAHWGNSYVTGRGLLAIVGKGQILQITLKAGETYVAHPSNLVGYTVTPHPPVPYRLKSSTFQLQVPSIGIGRLLPDTKFFKVMRESDTWRALTKFILMIRTWSRRTIFGDRLFMQFSGPTTLLLQTRASRLSDVLSARDVNEIADAPAGVVESTIALPLNHTSESELPQQNAAASAIDRPTRLSVASVGKDGKVNFEETERFKAAPS